MALIGVSWGLGWHREGWMHGELGSGEGGVDGGLVRDGFAIEDEGCVGGIGGEGCC